MNGFGCEVPEGIRAEYTKRWEDNPHLRGPYDANPDDPSTVNRTIAADKANADRKIRERAKVVFSDSEVEASLAQFNRQFADKFGG